MKNPFKSKTIWGLIITAGSLIAGMFNIEINAAETKGIVGFLSDNWESLSAAVGVLIAAYGRFKATQAISFGDKTAALIIVPFLVLSMGTAAQAGEEPLAQKKAFTHPGWYVDAYTTGLFPTGANDTDPFDRDTIGGGVGIGYRFHDLLSVAVTGQGFYDSGLTIQQYTVDSYLFLPSFDGGAAEFDFLPDVLSDFLKRPDFSESRIYVLIGAGVHFSGNDASSLLRAGVGVEMPLTEKMKYFIDGTWNVVGISSSDAPAPFAIVRIGVRIPF